MKAVKYSICNYLTIFVVITLNRRYMATFNMYTFQFSPKVAPKIGTLLDDYFAGEQNEIMSKKNSVFANALLKFDFVHYGRRLSAQLILNHDNIIAFKVANKKRVVLEKEFVESVETNEPSTLVIVCNDPEIQRIAIEQHREAFQDTDIVANFIQSSISRHISGDRLNISIRKEYQETEFWDFVRQYPEQIQMVRFELDYPNLPRLQYIIGDVIKEAGRSIDGDKALVEYQSSKSSLTLNEGNEYLINLNKVSSEGGNPIKLRLRGHREHMKTGNTTVTKEIDELEITADNIEDIKELFKVVKGE